MKNEFKKRDAKGNQLPEKIGKGINKEHLEKVMNERNLLDEIITCKISKKDKEEFLKECAIMRLNPSFVIREMINNFKNNQNGTRFSISKKRRFKSS